jgi:hypothetical protein
MHRAEDLEAAGAEFVCIWPEELVAYLKPGETCALGVCTLPSVVAGQPPVMARVPAEPGAVRRQRRRQAAAALSSSLDGCDCRESCCTAPESASDPLLRQILTVLGSQVSGERLSTRTEEAPRSAHQQLSPMAAPNGGRIPPH